MNKLDPYTFGDSLAAQALVDILHEHANQKYVRSVSRFLSSNNKLIKELAKIQDREVKYSLVNMYMESLDNFKFKFELPMKVVSFSKNVLHTKIKQEIFDKENNGN